MSTRFSPDGLYYWDGAQWVSTLSHDGRTRWNGTQWVPVQTTGSSGYAAYTGYVPDAPARQPTSWTRPLQYAFIAYYAITAVYAMTLPFTMGPAMTQAINQSIQQQSTYATPPPGLSDMMGAMFTFVFGFAALVGLAIAVVGIIAALRRWVWAYYAILVLFGLGVLSILGNAVELAVGSALPSAYGGVSFPSWIYVSGILIGLANVGLFVWMLVALLKRGPWGMTRPAA